MSNALVTAGIDQLIAEPGPHDGWTIRFRSSNAGFHHQLYLNGRLGDWTDTPDQRSFFLDCPAETLSICIAAVSPLARSLELSEQLPPEQASPPWVYRPRIPRSTANGEGQILEILGDHGTGAISELPLAAGEMWPFWMPHWAFGQDAFGEGGFGYDGSSAPGLGEGAFGAGAFGFGADLMGLEAALDEEGTHQIVLRVRAPDGQVADSGPLLVESHPPGRPPRQLAAVAYDHQSQQLTLQIS